jgi:GNAT superfamily N-acetyltransferase
MGAMAHLAAPADSQLLDSLTAVGANVGFVRAVLDGVVDGQVWISESVGTGAAYARHHYGMSLIWGDRLGEAVDEVVAHVATRIAAPEPEWLQVDPRWAALPWAEALRRAAPGAEVTEEVRANFAFDPQRFARQRAGFAVGDGWELAPATAEDFAFDAGVAPSAFWHDAEQFLAHGGGWCARRDGVVGAMAFASFPLYDGLEIGIETRPEVRGQGLGTAVAAAMIDDLLARGTTPVWSCRRGNAASFRLATRLGFVPTVELPYLML